MFRRFPFLVLGLVLLLASPALAKGPKSKHDRPQGPPPGVFMPSPPDDERARKFKYERPSGPPPGVLMQTPAEHDRARSAVRAGRIPPLGDVLDRVQRSHPGRVLDVQLDRGGPDPADWSYRIKILSPDGHVRSLRVDAVTGAPR
jgi:hypothetical protein